MTTGDVVYSLRFSLIKILPEPGFDLGATVGESSVLTARLHNSTHAIVRLHQQRLCTERVTKTRSINDNGY